MRAAYVLANLAHAWVLFAILVGAFVLQFVDGQPPCPLCVMQRIAMMMAAIGPSYVLLSAAREGLTPRTVGIGAGMTILASLLGAAIAIRQVLLHILPGDPGFGSPVLGYHLYTWATIAFACSIAAAGLQLVGLRWLGETGPARAPGTTATFWVLVALFVANILSVIAEAGIVWRLPDNPTGYLLFR